MTLKERCIICDTEIINPTSGNQKTCSDGCKKERERQKNREYAAKNREKMRENSKKYYLKKVGGMLQKDKKKEEEKRLEKQKIKHAISNADKEIRKSIDDAWTFVDECVAEVKESKEMLRIVYMFGGIKREYREKMNDAINKLAKLEKDIAS